VASDGVFQHAVSKASVTRAVVVERDALAQLPRIVAQLQPGRTCRIVAVGNTMEAAGHRAQALLRVSHVRVEPPLVLDATPRLKPDADAARRIGAEIAATGAVPIAVGAGVVNDITKLAAQTARTPYACVATAASMDGYAASGASMLDQGFKRTMPCAPPIGVVADLDVISRAPPRMAAWGYGDLAGKLVAGADWLLADAAGEDPLSREPFELVQDNVKQWLSDPRGIAAHDAAALGGLMEGLLISGFAMQMHGNSRPASGSDHQLAHVWEMDHVAVDGEAAAHGACVGVGAVAMTALYEWLLAQDVPRALQVIDARVDRARVEAEIAASFADQALVASARAEMTAKLDRAPQRVARLRALAACWEDARQSIRATLVPAATLAQGLRDCGAPSHPGDLGIPMPKLTRDYRRARLIRRRYTILDCLEDLGWLDRAIGALFAPDGYWGLRPVSTGT